MLDGQCLSSCYENLCFHVSTWTQIPKKTNYLKNGLHALIVNLKKWRTRDDEGSQGSNHSQEFYGLLRVEVFYGNLRALPSLIMFSMESFGTRDCTC